MTRKTQATGEPDAGTPASSCEVGAESVSLERSRVIRRADGGWDGVRARAYKPDTAAFEGVTRRVLAAPLAAGFEVRYFEIDADGYSSLERHEHVHVVVCLRGRGRVRIGADEHDVGFGDVVYIAPGDAHQFRAAGREPFGFLCVVDAERDRPVPLDSRSPSDQG